MNTIINFKMLIISVIVLGLISSLTVIMIQNNNIVTESNSIEKSKIDQEKREMEEYKKAFTG